MGNENTEADGLTDRQEFVLGACMDQHEIAVQRYRQGLSAYLRDQEAFLDGLSVGVEDERLRCLIARTWRLVRTWREKIEKGYSEYRRGGKENDEEK